MKECEKIVFTDLINKAKKFIPVVYPLQQFVATNPLWGLVETSIDEAGKALYENYGVRYTMSFNEYYQYYNCGRVNDDDLTSSIDEFILSKSWSMKDDSRRKSNIGSIIHSFLTDIDCYEKMLSYVECRKERRSFAGQILFSKQIRSLGSDDAFEFVLNGSLGFLSMYFNQSKFQERLFAQFQREVSFASSDAAPSNEIFVSFVIKVLQKKSQRWKRFLEYYPKNIDSLLYRLLSELDVPKGCMYSYILNIFFELKGWVGFVKWQNEQPNCLLSNRPVKLEEILVLWLLHEVYWQSTNRHYLKGFVAKYNQAPPVDDWPFDSLFHKYAAQVSSDFNDGNEGFALRLSLSFDDVLWIWQRAYELGYQRPLYQSLLKAKSCYSRRCRILPKAQWIFCIDTRSEGIRRQLENIAHYETFGYAGFFGLAFHLRDKVANTESLQCPALIRPDLLAEINVVNESIFGDVSNALSMSVKQAKKSTFSSFVIYEGLGFWFAVKVLIKNYGYNFLNVFSKMLSYKSRWFKRHNVQLSFSLECNEPSASEALVDIAENLLRSIGLVEKISDIVVICGHHASTENNPYQSALDCGACGGNSGMPNAVLVCEILNRKDIREALKQRGIFFPEKTVFVPACHNTTTDEFTWYDAHCRLLPYQELVLRSIKADAKRAGKQCCNERKARLPGDKNALRRSRHWAELIPEWGLANNAAMVVAPRSITKSLNLDRRVFLHSYDWQEDVSGKVLQSILLGPVIVAHWINSQYYFSSVEPDFYGSGNKAIHNILPNVGVIEGNQSDLKYGLPLQSVFFRSARRHEPVRLCVYIDADNALIQRIVRENEVLNNLTRGRWLTIISLWERN